MEVPFLHFWDFTLFVAAASTSNPWMVTHPSDNHGPSCLTSVFLRELGFPTWYIRIITYLYRFFNVENVNHKKGCKMKFLKSVHRTQQPCQSSGFFTVKDAGFEPPWETISAFHYAKHQGSIPVYQNVFFLCSVSFTWVHWQIV